MLLLLRTPLRQPSESGGGSTPTPSPTPVVPLSAIASYQPTTAPIAVNHQGQFPSVTISFNLAGGMALSDAVAAIQQMQQRIAMPGTVHGSFSGTAQAFQTSLASEPFLILAALVAVYIVLGILYESYIHPITILSTLPSAGVGAVLALMISHTDLSVIGIIGILLLIGIVEEERHPDGGLRAGSGARARHAAARSYLSSVLAASPPHLNDDNGGLVRCVAIDHIYRDGLRAPAAARHNDSRRSHL